MHFLRTHRSLLSPFTFATLAVALVVACSDSSSEPQDAAAPLDDASAPDASASDAASSDATVSNPVGDDGGFTDAAREASAESDAGDASLDAPFDAPVKEDAGDASAADASDSATDQDAAPSAQLLATGNLVPLGVTSDGWVVYENLTDSSIGAVSTSSPADAGSSVVTAAGSVQGTPSVTVSGSVVFVDPNTNDDPGPLVVWTSATGAHTIPNAVVAGPGFMPIASADGSRILYLTTGADGGYNNDDLIEANPDLSNPVVLATGIDYANAPQIAGSRFVVYTETALTDGGYAPSLDSYDDAGGKTHLYGLIQGFTTSPVTGQVFVSTGDADQDVVAISAAGGPVTQVAAHVGSAFSLTPDGSRGVYVVGSNVGGQIIDSVWMTPTVAPAPVQLPATPGGGDSNAATFTPDGTHFTFVPGSNEPTFTGLWTASTVAGDEVVFSVVPGIDATYVSSRLFSADSSSLAALVGFNDGSSQWGLAVAPVNGPTLVPVAGADVVTTNVTPATGSRFVYSTGANLWVVDAAQPGAPMKLAALAVSGAFVLTPPGTSVVYAGTGANGAALYALALP